MLPPVVAPRIVEPHMNIPIYNNVDIPGATQRGGAYLVQAISAPTINYNNKKRVRL
jgi:hypothetical protein